jgi:spore coat polysaccharide biosynthesis protein SpsF (cytidylyltransferase family)
MSSTRLPGKILKKLVDNVTILDLLIDRVSNCDFIDRLIIATSVNPKD